MTVTSLDDALGKRTLLMGDVGSGKTTATRLLLEEAVSRGLAGIAVLDLAPPARSVGGVNVGGQLLVNPAPGVRVLRYESASPRLSARSPVELIDLAEANRIGIDPLLEQLVEEPSKLLFVNDVSIYLQRGELDRLWSALATHPTVVANGYIGDALKADKGTGVSLRERREMLRLAVRMDKVVHMEQRLTPKESILAR